MAKRNYKDVDYDHRCLDCNAPMKRNLLDRVPGALRCHTCTMLRSNSLNFNRDKYRARQRRLISTWRAA